VASRIELAALRGTTSIDGADELDADGTGDSHCDATASMAIIAPPTVTNARQSAIAAQVGAAVDAWERGSSSLTCGACCPDAIDAKGHPVGLLQLYIRKQL
jgi:hypothetical protein